MSNIINSHISNSNNTETAFSRKKEEQYIKAVQSLPVYSVSSAIKEQDEFRKQVTFEQEKTLNKKKKNFPKMIFVAAVAAAGALILLLKNKNPVNKA